MGARKRSYEREYSRLVLGCFSMALALGLLGILMAGCALPSVSTLAPSTTPTPLVISAPGETPPATLAGIPTTTSPTAITMTVWTGPFFAPGETTDAERLLVELSRTFSEEYPNYHLDWVIKPATGPGNLREFLLAAQVVAPAILPDIVVLELRDLGALTKAGLLQPIDELVSEEVQSDLFPFARESSRIDGQWYAVPFAANIEHLAYNTILVDAPPLTWSDVLSDVVSYAFPAGGQNGMVNDAFLIQYMALGGRLFDEQGLPILDEKPLIQVLSFYADGIDSELFPLGIMDFQTTQDALSTYERGDVDMCNVRSDLYLANQDKLRNSSFATIPTWNGTVATMGRGLALAVITPDPARQAAVKAFVEWALASEQISAWTRVAGLLPVRTSVMNAWATEDNYYAFARWQLASAYYAPSEPVYDQIYVALQQAVHDVLLGSMDPLDAASRAVSLVKGKG